MALRAVAYVDGYNLYYGALKDTPYRWLDVAALCRTLLPVTQPGPTGQPEPMQLLGVKYFTAPIKPKFVGDHGPDHQAAYMAALREHTGAMLTIHEGYYQQKKVRMRAVDTARHGNTVEVWKSEEKGSDVNLAVCLVADAFLGHYDVAMLVSNDGDLGMAIDLVRQHTGKTVVVFLPNLWLTKSEMKHGQLPRHGSKVLQAKASFVIRYVRRGILARCQLPATMQSGLTKPANW